MGKKKTQAVGGVVKPGVIYGDFNNPPELFIPGAIDLFPIKTSVVKQESTSITIRIELTEAVPDPDALYEAIRKHLRGSI